MITLILTAIAAILIYRWCLKTYWYWNTKHIKQVKPCFPFIGNMAPIILRRKPFIELIGDLYRAYPNERYYGYQQFIQPMLLVRDLNLIKSITVKDFDNFLDHYNLFSEGADPLLSRNLFSQKGQRWKHMRALLSPTFTSSKMKNMYSLLVDCSERFTNFFLQNKKELHVLEVKDCFTRFTNDAIASIAFGLECDSLNDKENEFYRMGKTAANLQGFTSLRFVLLSVLPILVKLFNMRLIPQEVNDFFHKIVGDTIEMRRKNNIKRPDILQLLIDSSNINEENGVKYSNGVTHEVSSKAKKLKLDFDDVVAQAFLFFFGGFESTASLLSFVAYELALNPDVQKKLHKEIDEEMAKGGGKLNYDSNMNMKYLDAVISETLRKWPPGFVMDRACNEDFYIEPKTSDEKPFIIEKGTVVTIPVYGLHHDPQYFPEPEKFNPDRFLDDNKDKIVPGSYLPFGSGPRICIASRFALMENKALIAHFLSKFEIVTVDRTPVPLRISKTKFNMIPDEGFWLGFKKRKL